jgi:Zn-dependent protease with chaperone function
VIFAVRRLIKLRGGGDAIAKMVSARQVKRNATDLDERRLLNVVDEMAIASGVAVPSVWVMDKEEGINAFAAGYSPNQAVIVVTKGTLTKLNRDELQGVIGHEFSHILNGDMRLNVRLIGILAGIVVVGEAGLVIIKLGAEAGDTGAIPFIIWGAIVAAVGYIGVFFGRMIKAAVSRQREFLADSSSVQFTRNPDGLLSALQKIRKEGAPVSNAYAGEMSHMFFSQAITPKLFSDLFATHPSIDERVASITGRKLEPPAPPGDQQKGAQGLVNTLLALVGNATPEHVDQASKLLTSLPESLKGALDTPDGARRVVYAYLFGGDESTRKVQIQALIAAGDGATAAGIEDLIKTLRQLGPAARLPVLTLALPALRQMDQTARNAFLRAVDGLVEADSEVTLDEFVIRTILQRQLSANSSRAERSKYKDLKSVQADMVLLLATLARAGSTDPEAQNAAFAKGAARLGVKVALPPGTKLAADAVTAALDRLRQVTPMVKPDIVAACVDTALADEEVVVAEMELLRAIGMAIDCPLPPTLETQAVA